MAWQLMPYLVRTNLIRRDHGDLIEIATYQVVKCVTITSRRTRDEDSDSDTDPDDDGPDHPDSRDMVLWDLMLIRANNNPTVLRLLAVTRNQIRDRDKQRSNDQPRR